MANGGVRFCGDREKDYLCGENQRRNNSDFANPISAMKQNKVFDTSVQLLKYNVLKEVVRSAYDGTLDRAYIDIPKKISPGPKAELRCCIYKERAILQERVISAPIATSTTSWKPSFLMAVTTCSMRP